MLTGFCILILVAILAYIIAKHVVVRGIRHLITKLKFANHDIMSQHSVIRRIANIVPAIVIMNGIVTVPHLSAKMVSFVQMAAQAFIFLTIALAIGELLNIFNLVYQRNPKSRKAHQRLFTADQAYYFHRLWLDDLRDFPEKRCLYLACGLRCYGGSADVGLPKHHFVFGGFCSDFIL